jgi:DNA-binding response OmpR family regulator
MITFSDEQLDALTEHFKRSLAATQDVKASITRVLYAAQAHHGVDVQNYDHIVLPRRERRALELLAGRPGVWFTSDQLVEAVWSFNEDWPELPHATLWSHMSKLRKRCRKYGVHIEAKRHTGYRLVV